MRIGLIPAASRTQAKVWLACIAVLSSLLQAPASQAQPRRRQRVPAPTAQPAPPPEPATPPTESQPTPEPQPAPAPAPETPPPPPAETQPTQPQEPPASANAPDAPPPPQTPGDYAGRGEAGNSAQDDFAEAEMEYRKPVRREFSIRFDPLNWLLLGVLRVELEATLWKFISLELIPAFVTTRSPIALNYAGLDDPLTQHSNGIGPLSGASLGAGFWLSGEPFHGYVLRFNFANYGYIYRSVDKMGVIDRVTFTERRLMAFFGSHSRFGPFTFAGGFGLGYELHRVERCGLATVSSDDGTTTSIAGRSDDCHGKQLIALDRNISDRYDLNGPLHPVYFEARFSLGLVF